MRTQFKQIQRAHIYDWVHMRWEGNLDKDVKNSWWCLAPVKKDEINP